MKKRRIAHLDLGLCATTAVVLTAFVIPLAHAGSYGGPVYSGNGAMFLSGNGFYNYGPVSAQYGGGWGYVGNAGATISASGTINVASTFSPAYSGEPVPQDVILKEWSQSTWGVVSNSAQNNCAETDGLGDIAPLPTNILESPSPPIYASTASSNGTHYSVLGGTSVENITRTPTLTFSLTGQARGPLTGYVTYNSTFTPVNINVTGATLVSGQWEALSGTRINVSCSPGGTWSGITWALIGRTRVIKNYDTTNNTGAQVVPLSSNDLSQQSVTFYDTAAESVQVHFAGTYTAVAGATPLSVTAATTITFLRPSISLGIPDGSSLSTFFGNEYLGMSPTNAAPLDAIEAMLDTVTWPTGFSGTLSDLQVINSSSRTATRNANPGYQSTFQVVNNSTNQPNTNALDVAAPSYPYYALPPNPANSILYDDSPSVAPPNLNDGGGNNWTQVTTNESYSTYIAYTPSNGGILVPLAYDDWSWAGTATYANGLWNSPPQAPLNDVYGLWDPTTMGLPTWTSIAITGWQTNWH